MKVLITGADGFIGKNLICRCLEDKQVEVFTWGRKNSKQELFSFVAEAQVIFHFAGINRPESDLEFEDNIHLAGLMREAILASANQEKILFFSSSIHAQLSSPYGISKKRSEEVLCDIAPKTKSVILRLPNIFGKWSKPNYNSAIATFCHNTIYELPITVNDKDARLSLLYIDDLISWLLHEAWAWNKAKGYSIDLVCLNSKIYDTTVGEIQSIIASFSAIKKDLKVPPVGHGLTRALYSTYVSFLPPEKFKYSLPMYADPRGIFVEALRTGDSGQFSFFTAKVGVTRGGHYHHSKTEKFLVISGLAKFRFRHIMTEEYFEIEVSGDKAEIVETIPGWAHDITNIGDSELIVMLWANEIFDRDHPDTIGREVSK